MTLGKSWDPSRKKGKKKLTKFQKMRRKRIQNTILLLLLLVFVGAGGAGAIYAVRNGGFFVKTVEPYAASNEFSDVLASRDSQRAASFAKNLCVVESDVALDGVSLGENQEGLLLDLNEKEVLFSQGAFDRIYPASITKIMTGILALKYGNMEDIVTISEEDLNLESEAQVCGFWVGDQLTMDQLVHCLLVYSGNDAASAIATHIGGSIQGFVEMMNSYAAELGCTGTHFTNPHGLHEEDHYTTPYDIYLMLKEALNYPEFTRITQLSSYTVEYTRSDGSEVSTYLEATDHYLTGEATPPKNVTVLGGKTGTTDLAGNCLAILVQNAYGKPYISIVMGAATKPELYQQMNSLLQNINV